MFNIYMTIYMTTLTPIFFIITSKFEANVDFDSCCHCTYARKEEPVCMVSNGVQITTSGKYKSNHYP